MEQMINIIYNNYKKQQSESQDYINAIQTYINISDTTLLFKYIKDSTINSEKEKNNKLLKDDIFENKFKGKDLKNNLESLTFHLNNDIRDIKQLLLFNLYLDNEIKI